MYETKSYATFTINTRSHTFSEVSDLPEKLHEAPIIVCKSIYAILTIRTSNTLSRRHAFREVYVPDTTPADPKQYKAAFRKPVTREIKIVATNKYYVPGMPHMRAGSSTHFVSQLPFGVTCSDNAP